MNSTNILIFIISAFALGGVIVMSRDRIPQQLKRGMAITTIVLVATAFFLIVYSMLNL